MPSCLFSSPPWYLNLPFFLKIPPGANKGVPIKPNLSQDRGGKPRIPQTNWCKGNGIAGLPKTHKHVFGGPAFCLDEDRKGGDASDNCPIVITLLTLLTTPCLVQDLVNLNHGIKIRGCKDEMV